MKRFLPLATAATAVILSMAVSACGGPATASGGGAEVTTLKYQGSANSVTLPELAADLGYLDGLTLEWVGNTISGPQDIQSAATNQTDFGGAFTGAVVKLADAGAQITGVVNYYGSDDKTFTGFYVLKESPIRTAKDLIGKKIGVNTLGGQSEAVIHTYLANNGLSEAEIKQVQLVVLPPNDTEQAIRRGQIDAGSLGSVLQDKALAAGGLRALFTDVEFFGSFPGGQYVFRDDFIKENPTTVRTFTTGVAKAIEWETTTPRADVIARFTKIIQARGRSESTDALQYWKSVGVPNAGIIEDKHFTLWAGYLKDAGLISGELQPSKYYTNDFNDLAGLQAPTSSTPVSKG
ncbi:ABC-type nitrate/sulfonate/bicarbonate transport system, substrate-binding protein [Arthrobacter alpinus]|uniref:ABC-type nitrate/sulfonate/bicarbonate transport system, substrate-binding protein n=1 Tax=Arthrobacter alpinus TaxID=656366 RepID=A0A1H5NG77_9MICC|nr:ABC transporter substrate-binding protein [Arthrobacter alpinus]SEF00460.1 ABC-type nitrate/sulfonate/bicarbonate transport system, substrate-binding protein [Arthrobacter alpinus]